MLKGISKDEYRAKQTEKAKDDQSEYFNESINKLSNSIDTLRQNIEDLRATTGTFLSHVSSELKEFKIQLDYVSHETKGRLGDVCLELEGHKGRYKILEENFQSIKDLAETCDRETSYLWHEVSRLETEAESCASADSAYREDQNQKFDQKLKQQLDFILSRPTGVPELRKDLEAQIELNTVNGQNSILRSSNCEKDILLINKKIEQIFLLLKRHQLDFKQPTNSDPGV